MARLVEEQIGMVQEEDEARFGAEDEEHEHGEAEAEANQLWGR